jgi:hypothetical protein
VICFRDVGTHNGYRRPVDDREVSVMSDSPESLREVAVQSLHRKQAFARHAVVYVLVNLMLIGVWLVGGITSGQWAPWFLFPLFGWGIGLALQGWSAYQGQAPSEARIQAEMDRLSGERPPGRLE